MTETGPILADTALRGGLQSSPAGEGGQLCVRLCRASRLRSDEAAVLKGKRVVIARWEAALRKAKARAGIGRPCIQVGDFTPSPLMRSGEARGVAAAGSGAGCGSTPAVWWLGG